MQKLLILLFYLSLLPLSLYVRALEQKTVLLAVVGDSISYGYPLSTPSQRYGELAVSRLHQKVNYHNFAVNVSTCANWARWANVGDVSVTDFLSQPHTTAVAVIDCGLGDIMFGATPATAYESLLQLVGVIKLHSTGPVTMLVSTLTDTTSSFISEANRSTFNSYVIGGASSGGYTVLNWGADALLGCSGCASNTTYFADGVHPAERGHWIMAENYLAGALNSLEIH
jgi:lysophospholipase L1-like esterase